ncbi:putative RNA polymerase II subunit B1 CTD phosphatase rpap2 isoform X1, partial [Silurus asotus]
GKAAQVRRSAEEEARRKEILKESLRERLELERRALQVVERLLDDSVTEEFLVDCARLITPANYRDAVEERSIAKMCGYPVCSNKLVNIPRQRFKISTKTNKVYEITERKCFCCNFCYKASKYLEVQISKSPLWLRKEERPSEVKLLKKGDGGTSGLEVKLSDRHVTTSDIENPIPESTGSHRGIGDDEGSGDGGDDEEEEEEQGFVSSVVSRPQQQHRRHVHWGDLPRQGGDKQQTCEGDPQTSGARSERETRSDGAQVSQAISDSLSVEETSNVLDQVALSDSDGTSLNISRVGMSKQTAAGLRNLLKSSGRTRAEAPVVTLSLTECLTRTLMEWRTEETARFLCGPGSTSYAEAEPQSDGDEEELDEDDLEDVEKVKCSGDAVSAAAPDYETLSRETQMLELQVHEFYRGECVLPEKVQTHTEVSKHNTLPGRFSLDLLLLMESTRGRYARVCEDFLNFNANPGNQKCVNVPEKERKRGSGVTAVSRSLIIIRCDTEFYSLYGVRGKIICNDECRIFASVCKMDKNAVMVVKHRKFGRGVSISEGIDDEDLFSRLHQLSRQ